MGNIFHKPLWLYLKKYSLRMRRRARREEDAKNLGILIDVLAASKDVCNQRGSGRREPSKKERQEVLLFEEQQVTRTYTKVFPLETSEKLENFEPLSMEEALEIVVKAFNPTIFDVRYEKLRYALTSLKYNLKKQADNLFVCE